MTQEEKAKRYDEVFNMAKEWYNNPNSSNIGKSYLYAVFPELKENEDERMWNLLKKYVHYNISDLALDADHITREQLESWLEKQGSKPRYNIGDIICDKSCTTLNKEAQPNMEIVDIQNGMYICDKGSFPVSQQDEYELVSKKIGTKLNDDSVSNELREASFAHAEKELKSLTFPDNLEFELIYTFEEGAKWQAAQKHNWSDEDEEMLNLIIKRLQSHADVDLEEYSKEYDWLNSLEDRFTWKPSDEQIKALEHFVRSIGESGYLSPYDDNTKLLYSLLEDLKKL